MIKHGKGVAMLEHPRALIRLAGGRQDMIGASFAASFAGCSLALAIFVRGRAIAHESPPRALCVNPCAAGLPIFLFQRADPTCVTAASRETSVCLVLRGDR